MFCTPLRMGRSLLILTSRHVKVALSASCSLQVFLPEFGDNGMRLDLPESEAVVVDMEYDFIIGLDAIMESDLLPLEAS